MARGEGTLPKGQGTQRWRRRRGRGTAAGALAAPNRRIFEEERRGADLSHHSARRAWGEGEAPPGTAGGASWDRVVVLRSDARGTAAGRRPPAAASAAGFGEVGQIGAGVGGGRRRGRRPDEAAAAAEAGGEGQRLRWSRLLAVAAVAAAALIGRDDVDELAPLPDQAGGGRLGQQQGGHGGAASAVLAVGGAGAGGAPAVGGARVGAANVAAAASGGGGDLPAPTQGCQGGAAVMVPLAARWLPLVGARVEGAGPAVVVAVFVVAGRQRAGGVAWVGVPGARISTCAREAKALSVAVVGVAIVAASVGVLVVAVRFQDGHLGGEGRQALGRGLAVQRPLPAIGPEPAVGAGSPPIG